LASSSYKVDGFAVGVGCRDNRFYVIIQATTRSVFHSSGPTIESLQATALGSMLGVLLLSYSYPCNLIFALSVIPCHAYRITNIILATRNPSKSGPEELWSPYSNKLRMPVTGVQPGKLRQKLHQIMICNLQIMLYFRKTSCLDHWRGCATVE
jgi:hypothetical protein